MIKEKIIKVEKEEKITDKAFCSFCKKEFDEVTTSFNGFGQMHISFGYGSGFDNDCFILEICDDCFLKNYFELLKEQFKQKGYSLGKLSDKFKTLAVDHNHNTGERWEISGTST
jgi:hypothetical protein